MTRGATAPVNGYGEHLLHILVVPVRSEGHINGLLRLAQAITAEKGVLVTFAYPARLHSLALKRNKLPFLLNPSSPQRNPMLRIEVLDDGLPLEETHPVSDEDKKASFSIFQKAVQVLLDDLLLKSKPSSSSVTPQLPPLSCIIADTFTPWAQDLADAAGLPRIDFWTSTAAVYSMGTQLSSLLANGTLPLPKSCWQDDKKWTVDAPLIEGIPGLPPFPPTDLPVEFVRPEDESDWKLQFMVRAFARVREAHTILVHTVHELESRVFGALRERGFPIYAVGPLLDSTTPAMAAAQQPSTEGDRHECLDWLDMQPDASVVYVAMGSIAKLEISEMHALALALEAEGRRFLWVVREDSVSTASLSEAFPDGFLRRSVDKGTGLIISWSPQAEVLAHPAVGGFFSHCGWNSTLESISQGVPMVACPRAAEQRSNARWIVENWKIGVELERQQDGRFTKEAVERALKALFAAGSDGGPSDYKKRVLQVKEMACAAMQEGGDSRANLVSFLQRLRHSD